MNELIPGPLVEPNPPINHLDATHPRRKIYLSPAISLLAGVSARVRLASRLERPTGVVAIHFFPSRARPYALTFRVTRSSLRSVSFEVRPHDRYTTR